MNCTRACEIIGAYLDHELAASDVAGLEEHIRECPACAAELRAADELVGQLRDADPAPAAYAPPEIWTAIAAHLGGGSV